MVCTPIQPNAKHIFQPLEERVPEVLYRRLSHGSGFIPVTQQKGTVNTILMRVIDCSTAPSRLWPEKVVKFYYYVLQWGCRAAVKELLFFGYPKVIIQKTLRKLGYEYPWLKEMFRQCYPENLFVWKKLDRDFWMEWQRGQMRILEYTNQQRLEKLLTVLHDYMC